MRQGPGDGIKDAHDTPKDRLDGLWRESARLGRQQASCVPRLLDGRTKSILQELVVDTTLNTNTQLAS
jgi:hypothetical protein